MLAIPSTNVFGTLFIHFVNQSYNAACNYFNRSGAGVPIESMGTAYGLAVGSACAIALGMGKIVEKVPSLKRFAVFIPVLSTAAASSSNLAFTRADEIKVGADLVDEDGNNYGKSVIAGKQGVMQTALSRCVMVPFAVVLLPYIVNQFLEKRKLMPKNKSLATAVQLGVIFACLQGALPATLAVFPQTAAFNVTDLEIPFQQLKHPETNQPIHTLYAQKGL